MDVRRSRPHQAFCSGGVYDVLLPACPHGQLTFRLLPEYGHHLLSYDQDIFKAAAGVLQKVFPSCLPTMRASVYANKGQYAIATRFAACRYA